jgi:hypothetical protein
MRVHRFAMGVLAALAAFGIGPGANADQGLVQQFNSLFGPRGIILETNEFHLAHFTSDSLATLGLLVQQLAPGAADFPAVSSVPGLTFRYNAELQAFARRGRLDRFMSSGRKPLGEASSMSVSPTCFKISTS